MVDTAQFQGYHHNDRHTQSDGHGGVGFTIIERYPPAAGTLHQQQIRRTHLQPAAKSDQPFRREVPTRLGSCHMGRDGGL